MPRFLLGTQCFVDIAKAANLPPQRWLESLDLRSVPPRDVLISAVTPMIITATFAGTVASPYAVRVRQSCDDLVKRFVLGKRVVPVTKDIADCWGVLLAFNLTYLDAHNQPAEYDYRERLVMATAIEGLDGIPFTLVDKRQPAHTELEQLRLALVDPYVTHA